jgi:hypothetical protein
MNKITGIIIIYENGDFATPDVTEVQVIDKASGQPVG